MFDSVASAHASKNYDLTSLALVSIYHSHSILFSEIQMAERFCMYKSV